MNYNPQWLRRCEDMWSLGECPMERGSVIATCSGDLYVFLNRDIMKYGVHNNIWTAVASLPRQITFVRSAIQWSNLHIYTTQHSYIQRIYSQSPVTPIQQHISYTAVIKYTTKKSQQIFTQYSRENSTLRLIQQIYSPCRLIISPTQPSVHYLVFQRSHSSQ